LHRLAISTRAYAWVSREQHGAGQKVDYTEADEPIEDVPPAYFDILPGYDNWKAGEITPGGALELYVSAETNTGHTMVVPVKKIIEAKSR
jgi:hypothetical protein